MGNCCMSEADLEMEVFLDDNNNITVKNPKREIVEEIQSFANTEKDIKLIKKLRKLNYNYDTLETFT